MTGRYALRSASANRKPGRERETGAAGFGLTSILVSQLRVANHTPDRVAEPSVLPRRLYVLPVKQTLVTDVADADACGSRRASRTVAVWSLFDLAGFGERSQER